ncbi:MAG: peptide chain release factor 1, partial [Hamadaea sp.]|nr:peptide chain release factor 1 [Hamadaea sp.]
APPGRHGLAIFAHVRDGRPEAGADEVHTEVLNAPPPVDSAEVGPLPHVSPLLMQRGQQITWLRVVVDRTGATIEEVSAGAAPRVTQIAGHEDFPIRKVAPGAWSQARFQREAETTWQRNAQDVAEAVTELADRIAPEVVIVAGDVHARRLLVDRLPVRLRDRTVQTDAGSRAPGADPEALDDVTIQVIAQAAQQHADTALDRFRERGGELSATGLDAVVAAFNRGQVATLLLDPIGLAGHVLFLDPASGQLARHAEDMPGDAGERVLAEDAMIRAAATTDADLLMIGGEGGELPLRDGVGVVLRYSDEGTVHR